jgi:hypothetical protein
MSPTISFVSVGSRFATWPEACEHAFGAAASPVERCKVGLRGYFGRDFLRAGRVDTGI